MAKTYNHMFCQEPAMLDLLKSGFKKSILSFFRNVLFKKKKDGRRKGKRRTLQPFLPGCLEVTITKLPLIPPLTPSFEVGSHVLKVGFKLTMQSLMTLNFCSSYLHLLNAGL